MNRSLQQRKPERRGLRRDGRQSRRRGDRAIRTCGESKQPQIGLKPASMWRMLVKTAVDWAWIAESMTADTRAKGRGRYKLRILASNGVFSIRGG